MVDIVVVGSVALDSIITPFGSAERVLGGSADYFTIAASILGAKVGIVGVAGEDFPKQYLDLLQSKGGDLTGMEIAKGKTFFWKGEYLPGWNERVTHETQLGVFADFHPKIPEAYKDTPLLFLGNIHPALQLEVLDQVNQPGFAACDSMNLWIETERETLLEVMKRVDCVIFNEEEVGLLTGEKNMYIAGAKILEMGPKALVLKRGSCGAVLMSRNKIFAAPSYPVTDVQDPTGAGDSFGGGFMSCLAAMADVDFNSLKKAVLTGIIVSSFCVEAFSVERTAEISRDDFEARYNRFLEILQTGQ